jgi:hypothetical protein
VSQEELRGKLRCVCVAECGPRPLENKARLSFTAFCSPCRGSFRRVLYGHGNLLYTFAQYIPNSAFQRPKFHRFRGHWWLHYLTKHSTNYHTLYRLKQRCPSPTISDVLPLPDPMILLSSK